MSTADDIEFVPRAGIKTMIADSLAKREQMWGAEVAELAAKVDEVCNKVVAIAGDPSVPGSGLLPMMSAQMTEHIGQQREWRADDVAWRTVKDAEAKQILAIATQAAADAESAKRHVQQLKERMQLLGWLMMSVKAVKASLTGVVTVAETGKKTWAAVAALFAGLTFTWTLLHSIIPAIINAVKTHHISF